MDVIYQRGNRFWTEFYEWVADVKNRPKLDVIPNVINVSQGMFVSFFLLKVTRTCDKSNPRGDRSDPLRFPERSSPNHICR